MRRGRHVQHVAMGAVTGVIFFLFLVLELGQARAFPGVHLYVPVVGQKMPAMGLCIPEGAPRQQGRTAAVIDGDTIDVTIGGRRYRVRYIGVDTPERDEPFYGEATNYNRSLVEGRTLTLVRDVSETDRYGRLLRYVIADGVFVNYALVRWGYAMAATFPPDVACSSTFARAQEEARREGWGVWGLTPTPTPVGGGGQLRIAEIKYAGRDEYVTVHNDGQRAQPMVGWTLVSVVGLQVFAFPNDYTLGSGASVRVHSGPDAYERLPSDLFWTHSYIWNNGGDKAELRGPNGEVVASYCYGSGCP